MTEPASSAPTPNRATTGTAGADTYLYDAFVSYRHEEPDRETAEWLVDALETYRVPWSLVWKRRVKRRLKKVYRDVDQTRAGPHVEETIHAALRASRWLIVVGSPRARASEWVEKEANFFQSLGRGDRILPLLTEGAPKDAFPGCVDAESLAADLRPNPRERPRLTKRVALLKLVASLIGCEFPDLFRRDRRRKVIRIAAGAAAVLLVAAIGTSVSRRLAQADVDMEAERHRRRSAEFVRAYDETPGDEPIRRLLLAREAVREDATSASVSRLHDALTASVERLRVGTAPDPVRKAAVALGSRRVLTVQAEAGARIFATDGTEVATLGGAGGRIVEAALSPKGDRAAEATADGVVRSWDVATGKATELARGLQTATAMAFSPDGERLAVGFLDGRTLLFAHGATLTAPSHAASVSSVVFSHAGDLVLTSSSDHEASLFGPDGAVVARLAGHRGAIYSAAFSPDDSRIATASDDGTAIVWDRAGNQLATLGGHRASVLSVAFSPEGQLVATASLDGTVRVFGVHGQEQSRTPDQRAPFHSAVFSPDGRDVLTAGGDNTARLWSRRSPRLEERVALRGHALKLRWAGYASNAEVVTFSDDGTVRAWDLLGGEGSDFTAREEGSAAFAGFLEGEARVLTVAEDGPASWWNVRARDAVRLDGHRGEISSACLSPREDRLLTCSKDGTARLWTLAGESVATLSLGGTAGLEDYVSIHGAFSPTGDRVATAGFDGAVRTWDADGRPERVLAQSRAPLTDLDFSPDGQRVLICSHDMTARILSVAGVEIAVLRHDTPVLRGAWSPRGDLVATGTLHGTVSLWDAEGRLLRKMTPTHGDGVLGIEFAPSGDRFVTASDDRTARIWDREGRSVLLEGHQGWVRGARFSPIGDQVLTRSDDGTVRLWSLEGRELAVLRVGGGGVHSAAFSPDGRWIVAGSSSGSIREWLARVDDLLRLAERRSFGERLPSDPDLDARR